MQSCCANSGRLARVFEQLREDARNRDTRVVALSQTTARRNQRNTIPIVRRTNLNDVWDELLKSDSILAESRKVHHEIQSNDLIRWKPHIAQRCQNNVQNND